MLYREHPWAVVDLKRWYRNNLNEWLLNVYTERHLSSMHRIISPLLNRSFACILTYQLFTRMINNPLMLNSINRYLSSTWISHTRQWNHEAAGWESQRQWGEKAIPMHSINISPQPIQTGNSRTCKDHPANGNRLEHLLQEPEQPKQKGITCTGP